MNETWWISESDLDDDQRQVISLELGESHLITGPPGSGKTNLLLLRAKFLTLAQQSNIQIVLFTRALREFIAAGAQRYAFRPDQVKTSHQFWSNLLFEYGQSRPSETRFEDQRRALVEAASRLVRERQLRNIYDAVLLDEAHDFWPEEVELFAKLGKTLFAVADSRQKIYTGEAPFTVLNTITDGQIALKFHYRNGTQICRLADAVGRDGDQYTKILPASNYDERLLPSTMSEHRCASLDEQIDRMISKLPDQLNAYPDEQIGVISPDRKVIARVWDELVQRGFSDVASVQQDLETLSFDPETRICVSTLHAAKGLEFRALHVLSCDGFRRRPFPRALVFTAVTRAKTSLDLYYSGDLLGFLDSAILSLKDAPTLPKTEDLF